MHKIYQNSQGRQTAGAWLLFHTGRGQGLEVQSFRGSLLFLVEDVLLGLLEVLVGDLHPALSEGHEACFCTDSLGEEDKNQRRARQERRGNRYTERARKRQEEAGRARKRQEEPRREERKTEEEKKSEKNIKRKE